MEENQDDILVDNSSDEITHTIPIDPFVSSNMDEVDEVVEEPVIEQVIDLEEEKKKKIKKILLISGISLIGVIFLILLIILILSPKKKESTIQQRKVDEELTFKDIVQTNIKNGNFDKELNYALKEIDIQDDDVSLIPIDIDLDDELELMAFIKNGEKSYLISFDVDEEILYDDYYNLNNNESLAFAYSIDKKSSCFYTDYNGFYTMILNRKMVIKPEDFSKEYYIVTKDFNSQSILENSITYKKDKKINISDLDKVSITKESLLQNNQLSLETMVSKAEEYFKEKSEKDSKDKEEQDKAKEQEEQRKEIFELNGFFLHYGPYGQESGSYGHLLLNRDKTCKIGEVDCTWSFGNHDFDGTSTSAILIHADGGLEVAISSWKSNSLSDNKNWSLSYQG